MIEETCVLVHVIQETRFLVLRIHSVAFFSFGVVGCFPRLENIIVLQSIKFLHIVSQNVKTRPERARS
jgi:hypothetical protein